MASKRSILLSRKKRIHGRKLRSNVVSISYLLKSEKKINYSVIDKWLKKVASRITFRRKNTVS
ncbi:MAG: hypothetical protein JXR31_12310 [Prolixibacteraceae bacterium]|nr:hypothetical protein [Prolixibacteraceae bacterium]